MKNVIYFCPRFTSPVGGVKVIHRHSELINSIGGESSIFYTSDGRGQTEWFNSSVRIKKDLNFNPNRDYVLLPESQIYGFWRGLAEAGVEYGIFVQNGYLLDRNIDKNDIENCYKNASHIICISEDAIRCVSAFLPDQAQKIIRVTYSVDVSLFRSEKKEKIITFMPRKMKEHSGFLIPILRRKLPPGWDIVPIDNLREDGVAKLLAKSSIFLAFSDFEGLPVPPVEAAFCKNYVIGYTGQGGKEYWSSPVFESVESGDVVDFLHKTLRRVDSIDRLGCNIGDGHLMHLKENFSKEKESKLITKMLEKISS